MSSIRGVVLLLQAVDVQLVFLNKIAIIPILVLRGKKQDQILLVEIGKYTGS